MDESGRGAQETAPSTGHRRSRCTEPWTELLALSGPRGLSLSLPVSAQGGNISKAAVGVEPGEGGRRVARGIGSWSAQSHLSPSTIWLLLMLLNYQTVTKGGH